MTELTKEEIKTIIAMCLETINELDLGQGWTRFANESERVKQRDEMAKLLEKLKQLVK